MPNETAFAGKHAVRRRVLPKHQFRRSEPAVRAGGDGLRGAAPAQLAGGMRMRLIEIVLAGLVVACSPPLAAPAKAPFDKAKIEELTGAKGTFNEKEGVFKVSVPRSDLAITAAGVKLTPPMGLTSWAAFKKAGKHTVVM